MNKVPFPSVQLKKGGNILIINYKESKRGFTLIELLTVIAILGILVLLAAPKFLGYTTQAKETQAKADIKTFETAIAAKLALDQDTTENWPEIEKIELESYRDNGSLFTIEGKVKEDYQFNGSYIDIPEEDFKGEVKSKLSGDFIMDSGGKIYYHDETLDNSSPNVVVEDKVRPDGITILKDNSGVKLANGDFIPAVTETDFTLGAKVAGYYSYTGSESKIYIPSDLKLGGNLITDANYMFNGSSVEKVVLLESNITNMNRMFASSQATTLDLSDFDTSNVTNMSGMFSYSQATTLDLSSFDTSKVADMSSMFWNSNATSLDLSSFDTFKVADMYAMFWSSNAKTLDLSSFDTSNVINMGGMFNVSQATSLDLSSFDTSNVTTMNWMFAKSQATTLDLSSFNTSNVTDMNYMFQDSSATTGYAKTQADADKFNATYNKPNPLNFTLK